MRKLVLISIITLVAAGLYAQAGETAQVEEEIRLELIWEKEFEEEIINVAFSEERTIVVTMNKIYSLDNDNGKLKYLRPTYQGEKKPAWRRTWVSPSKNGKYIGFYHDVVFNEKSKRFKTEKKRLAVFELIDNSGKVIWRREKEIYYETEFYAPSLAVSNQGYVVETDLDWYGKIYFYNPSGQMIKEVKVSENQFENCVTHGETWSDDGEYFAIFTDEGSRDDKNFVSYLLLYTKDGNELWRNQKKGFLQAYHNNVSVSSNNKYIVAFSRDHHIEIFDSQGSRLLKQRISKRHSSQVTFSASGEEIIDFSTIGVVTVISLRERKLVWQKGFPNAAITSLKEIAKSDILIVGLRNHADESSSLILLNRSNRDTISVFNLVDKGRSTGVTEIGCPLLNIRMKNPLNLLVVLPHKYLSYRILLSRKG